MAAQRVADQVTSKSCRQVGLPEAARVKRFIPFSDGRRDCVGQALGRLNYTSTLARLLGNFHFELAPEVLLLCLFFRI